MFLVIFIFVPHTYGLSLPDSHSVIQILTNKPTYYAGETIQIIGFYNPNGIIHLDLINPVNNSKTSTQVQSDTTGHFKTRFAIPQNAANGTWKILATSGLSHISYDVLVSTSGERKNEQNNLGSSSELGIISLKQSQSTISANNIVCKKGLNLIIKAENHFPACVSTNTALELILRGWAEQNNQEHQTSVIGTNYTMSYNGKNTRILGAVKNSNEQRLTIALDTTDTGVLSFTVPKSLLDLNPTVNDDSFYILTNSGSINPNETDTATDRTFAIPINPNDNQVTISVMSWLKDLARLGLSIGHHPATLDVCDTPFVPKKPDVSPLFPNDTQITTSYIPVFFMPANSTGKLCLHYTNWNSPSQSSVNIFEAQNLAKNTDKIHVSPEHMQIPTGETNIVFTIKSGNSGFYGIRLLCGGWPLAVGYDNKSRIVEDDFPWLRQTFMCPAITYSYNISGTSGIGGYYISEMTRSKIDYNIASTSVLSTHISPTIQNVTFTVHVQTFNDSSKFWFDIKDSQYVKFNGDPKLKQEYSNPCTWTFAANNAVTDERQWYKMVGKVTVTDRPVTIPPHTNGTYTFSILAKDLDVGYYGFNPIYYGVPVDSNIPPENMGGGSVADYYPVVIGLDKYLDPSGVCGR